MAPEFSSILVGESGGDCKWLRSAWDRFTIRPSEAYPAIGKDYNILSRVAEEGVIEFMVREVEGVGVEFWSGFKPGEGSE